MRPQTTNPYILVGIKAPPSSGEYNSGILHVDIMQAVADVFQIPIEQYMVKKRLRELVEPRHMAIFITRQLTHYPWKKLGGIFKRDHTSIMHACKTAKDLIDTDDSYKIKYNRIIEKLNQQTISNALDESTRETKD